MGKVKNLWVEKLEKVHDEYIARTINRREAIARLVKLGMSETTANDVLDAVTK